jgi:hypothetical protein
LHLPIDVLFLLENVENVLVLSVLSQFGHFLLLLKYSELLWGEVGEDHLLLKLLKLLIRVLARLLHLGQLVNLILGQVSLDHILVLFVSILLLVFILLINHHVDSFLRCLGHQHLLLGRPLPLSLNALDLLPARLQLLLLHSKDLLLEVV